MKNLNIISRLNLTSVELNEFKESSIEVLRIGTIQDRGFSINKKMLSDFVKNFDANVYGQDDHIPVNLSHNRAGEAAGWVKSLSVVDDKLMAIIQWTELGMNKIKKGLFKFISAELAQQIPHHKTGDTIKNVFIGAALTNIPALKGQEPITLSEEINKLLKDNVMLKTFLAELTKREFVSSDDKEMMHKMLNEAPEEAKEEVKEEVAEIDAKPEAPEEKKEEGEEGEEKKEEGEEKKEEGEEKKEEGEAKEGAEKKEEGEEKLSEVLGRVDTLEEQNRKLQEEVRLNKFNENFNKDLLLNESNGVGFSVKNQGQVVKFLMSLSETQVNEFNELLPLYKRVDFSEMGSSNARQLKTSDPDAIVALAEQLLKDKKADNISEAQKMATEQLSK